MPRQRTKPHKHRAKQNEARGNAKSDPEVDKWALRTLVKPERQLNPKYKSPNRKYTDRRNYITHIKLTNDPEFKRLVAMHKAEESSDDDSWDEDLDEEEKPKSKSKSKTAKASKSEKPKKPSAPSSPSPAPKMAHLLASKKAVDGSEFLLCQFLFLFSLSFSHTFTFCFQRNGSHTQAQWCWKYREWWIDGAPRHLRICRAESGLQQ
jgi:hypothetical protein